jgi:hypothetical protein
VKRRFSAGCVEGMCADITKEEIRKTIFSMNKENAPGSDGFSAGFFHKAWLVIREEVSLAILEFFSVGKLLNEANSTILTLILKKYNLETMSDYRPISCCNLVYKCIAKILANRLMPGLDDIICSAQGAFIPNRTIAENILLAQELVFDYHRNQGQPRCTLKFDLMKAYESVSWGFILHCLHCFGAPGKYVFWVKECITSTSYFISLNGSLVGYFQGKICYCHENSLLLEEAATNKHGFLFHPKCSVLKLNHLCNHLCFADDLLIFSGGKLRSVQIIKEVIDEFEGQSGL